MNLVTDNIFSQIAPVAWGLGFLCVAVYVCLSWKYNKAILPFVLTLLGTSLCLFLFYIVETPFFTLLRQSFVGCAMVCFLLMPSSIQRFIRLLTVYKSAQEQSEQWASMSDQAFEGIFHVDPFSYAYVDVNPSGQLALGYSLDELRQLTVEDIHPDSYELKKRKFEEVVKHRKPVKFQVWASKKSGKRIYVDLTLCLFHKNGKKYILANGRDLTRWILKNEQISQISRLYEVLTLCNRAISQIKQREALLARIADIIAGEGGFRLAWFSEREGVKVIPTHISGHSRGYIQSLKLDLDSPQFEDAPVVRAYKFGQIVCVNSIQTDPVFANYLDKALAAGVNSVAALPITFENSVRLVLTIYSDKEFAFDDKTQDLLANLSEDLSNALVNIAIENQRRASEIQLKRLSSAVDQSADAIMIISADGKIEYINPKFESLTGYLSAEVVGKSPYVTLF